MSALNLLMTHCEAAGAASETPAGGSSLRLPPLPTETARVLVVDDEAINRLTLTHLLRSRGMEVVEAASGPEALRIVASEPLDLVLLDISMPDFDGFQTMRFIRQARPKSELPVIMVTSSGDREPVIEAFRCGASDYITKPVDPDVGLARIRSQLSLARSHAAMRASEERYALAAAGANDGLWDWDLVTGRVYYSERWKAMLGFAPGATVETPAAWFDRIHHEDATRVEQDLTEHLAGRSQHFETELRVRCGAIPEASAVEQPGSDYRWMLCRGLAVRDDSGQAIRIAGSLTDITEGKVADALTGLPNRLLFVDRVNRCLAQSQRYDDRRFAVLYIDVDDFKLINDTLGHDVGDQFLVEVARRLERGVRECDSVVARLGGDEFAILLENLPCESDAAAEAGAVAVAERIGQAMAPPFAIADRELLVRNSIGVALCSDRCQTAEQLLREADAAMYFVKGQSSQTHQVFEPRMLDEANARLEMGSELMRATGAGELRTLLQPIVDLQAGRTAGFEALLRWQSARFGLVMPSEFIPLAEDNGAIVPLGRFVMRTACEAAGRLTAAAGRELRISVNVSPRQLEDDSLPGYVAEVLDTVGLPPDCLKVEVTESTIMRDPDRSIELLSRLRSLGATIGLDDFGTGYSSLSCLHQMPLAVLKIDRSFVSRLTDSESSLAIVETIVGLARSLRLEIIAEGVETAGQLAILRRLGCRYGQGYLFSRPVEETDAMSLLDRQWDVAEGDHQS